MSDDLSAIHAQTSAILAKLHDERGQPDVLDESFTQEYFKLIKDHLNFDAEEGGPRAPHTTEAKLSQETKGLVDVYISSKKEKFVVSKLRAVKTIRGTSQRVGSDHGKGTYIMTDVKGFPNITIKSGKAIVTFIGLPHKVISEVGTGEWTGV